MKRILKILITIFFLFLVGIVPMVLLYLGTRESGINLTQAIQGQFTLKTFSHLFLGESHLQTNFRISLINSFIYSGVVATIASLFSFIFLNWVSGMESKKATGLSFTLLTLTLLPQTYLIMPLLVVLVSINFAIEEHILIMIVLSISTIPVCLWIFYAMASDKLRKLQEMCAVDHFNFSRYTLRAISELRVEMTLLYLLAWALAWGNYLIPFSFGSNNSFSAIVNIASFSTHLGRDWAMIGASGFVVCLPGIIIGLLVGVYSMGKVKLI